MNRFRLLAGCWTVILCGNIVSAMEPMTPSADAARAFAEQRTRARQLIQQRAAKEAQDRTLRIEARRRAGISLQRPVKPMPWYQ